MDYTATVPFRTAASAVAGLAVNEPQSRFISLAAINCRRPIELQQALVDLDNIVVRASTLSLCGCSCDARLMRGEHVKWDRYYRLT